LSRSLRELNDGLMILMRYWVARYASLMMDWWF